MPLLRAMGVLVLAAGVGCGKNRQASAWETVLVEDGTLSEPALRRLRNDPDLNGLQGVLSAASKSKRAGLAGVLNRIGRPRLPPPVIALLVDLSNSEHERERASPFGALLPELRDDRVCTAFVRGLEDDSPLVLSAVLRALGSAARPPAAIGPCAGRLASAVAERVRKGDIQDADACASLAALETLEIGATAMDEAVRHWLSRGSESTCLCVFRLMRDHPGRIEGCDAVLDRILRDSDLSSGVASWLVEALGFCGGDDVRIPAVLERALGSVRSPVRQAASRASLAWVQRGHVGLSRVLVRAAGDSSFEVALPASGGLLLVPEHRVLGLERLRAALTSRDEEAQQLAVEIIAGTGESAGVLADDLLNLGRETKNLVLRIAIIGALPRLGRAARSGLPWLRELAAGREPVLRSRARAAVEEILHPER